LVRERHHDSLHKDDDHALKLNNRCDALIFARRSDFIVNRPKQQWMDL
jgi:hypothetical protein